jgi:hypothetical protein
MTNRIALLLLIAFGTLGLACEPEATAPPTLNLLSSIINGGSLSDGMEGVAPEARLELVFSSSLDQVAFEEALIMEPAANMDISFSNQGSKAILDLELAGNTTYTLSISGDAIGQNGGVLDPPFVLTFTTRVAGSAGSACTNGNADCLSAFVAEGAGSLPVYNSFPVFEAEGPWTGLTTAVIVVHGANRNAGDYFEYLMFSLQAKDLENEALLLAPQFQEAPTADHTLYWSGNGWREGQTANGTGNGSSFAVIDGMISQLADAARFPDLKKVIITGHSSGGLFTHVYAAANRSETTHSNLNFEYVVANSQYFYYPDGQRINESTNQLYLPNDCNGYSIWPLGYEVAPPYLSGTTSAEINDQFVNRSVTYLLGNGAGPDGALNTSDCAATLLGPSRYERGENMYRYMNLVYGDNHNHKRSIVPGIGHDGAGMYRSDAFQILLQNLID